MEMMVSVKERSGCAAGGELGRRRRRRTGLLLPSVGVDGLLLRDAEEEEEIRLAVWRRVTTLETGVVNNFAQAPAAAPTASSSRTLR